MTDSDNDNEGESPPKGGNATQSSTSSSPLRRSSRSRTKTNTYKDDDWETKKKKLKTSTSSTNDKPSSNKKTVKTNKATKNKEKEQTISTTTTPSTTNDSYENQEDFANGTAVASKESSKSPTEADNDSIEPEEQNEEGQTTKKKTKKSSNKRKSPKNTASDSEAEESSKTTSSASKSNKSKTKDSPAKTKKEKVPVQAITERDELPKLWEPDSKKKCFKMLSWNVDGLRAVCKNLPTALSDLVKKYDYPDLVCLQETKLQECHVDDPKLMLKGNLLHEDGYDSYWSCSTAKKGYSGTAVFIKRRGGKSLLGAPSEEVKDGKKKEKDSKQTTLGSFFSKKETEATDEKVAKGSASESAEKDKKTPGNDEETMDTDSVDENFLPLKIKYGLDKKLHDEEGRSIIVDYPLFSVLNLYVPNSGQKLERLDYRTNQWDKDLVAFVQQIEKERGVPVIWLGDLNVAHTALDIWNHGAKHLDKSAGTTPEERESFTKQLEEGYVDLFRHLHPNAKGQYTFWSTRAGNRPPNKGLRLDYFVGSQSLVTDEKNKPSQVVARDSYIEPNQLGSDHCPIILELELLPTTK